MPTNPIDQPNPMETRCKAHSRSGDRCRNSPILGGTVCRFHGGGAPQVQRRAKLRLLELVDPATAKLARILATTNDEKVALKTIEMIFDRTGMHARAGLDVEDSRALLVERLLELQPRDDDDVV